MGMDFSPPAILPPSSASTVLNAVSSNTSGSVTVGLYQAATLIVTGTNWRSDIVVEARVGGLDWIQLPVQGPLGLPLNRISANGAYYVTVAGFTQFRVNTTNFAGAGTVTVTAVLTMALAPRTHHRRVNNRIAQAYQQSVAAGATTTIFNGVDVSGYAMISFAFLGPTDGSMTGKRVQLNYIPQFNRDLGGSTGNGNTPQRSVDIMIDNTVGGGQSDFIFPKGELAAVSIKNFDTSAHLFDVWIIGIH